MFIAELFTTIIYQPFFNILVFFYWVEGKITQGTPDMGIAVIFLTILIRILLLPMSLSGHDSEADRREIAEKLKQLEHQYSADPIAFQKARKQLYASRRKIFAGELVSLTIQVIIFFLLYRIFTTGLEGADVHLLYAFMPKVELPFNLLFLERFDLAHTSVVLNLIQSLCIFALETLAIYTSPYPPAKGEVVRLQLIMPVVSFFIFMFLPAGKKLFVITTLLFSMILVMYKFIRRSLEDYKAKKEAEEAALAAGQVEEKVVVEVK